MENWRVELTSSRKKLNWCENPEGIFQGDALSASLFIIATMPLSHLLRKCTGGYKLHKSQEKNEPPKVHGQHQTVCQKWKRIGNLNTVSGGIQSRWDGICYWKMCPVTNEKQKMTNNRRNRITQSRKNQNPQRKGKLQILWNIGSGHHETCGDKRKKNWIHQENEKTCRNQTI